MKITNVSIDGSNQAGPHPFRPLRFWDMRSNGRCRHCYAPMNAHPMRCWVASRPIGDRRRAELSYEALNGSAESQGDTT